MKINRAFNRECYLVLTRKKGGPHGKSYKTQRTQEKVKLKRGD